jgi:hypothetical protein
MVLTVFGEKLMQLVGVFALQFLRCPGHEEIAAYSHETQPVRFLPG